MRKNRSEVPVFFDSTGKRWRRTKTAVFLCAYVLFAALLSFVPRVLADVSVSPFVLSSSAVTTAASTPAVSPSKIAYSFERDNVPVIGSGPLIRVLKRGVVDRQPYLLDPFTHKPIRPLYEHEIEAAGSFPYLLERYGQTGGKRIALTFDDGPDPAFTPQILDILAAEAAPSTFFALGENVVKFPDIAKRIAREGHVVANHTFSHVDFDYASDFRGQQEITQAQRAIRATVGRNPSYFRIPYGGEDDDSLRDNMRAILQAQQQGYVVTSYHFNSNDWQHHAGDSFQFPDLSGGDIVMLLHDAGGDRSYTVEYLRSFIPKAKAAGYSFVTIDELYQQSPQLYPIVQPTLPDYLSLVAAKATLVWPQRTLEWLFIIGVVLATFGMVLKIALASLFVKRIRYPRRKAGYTPFVSVIVPAYNEEKVLDKTIRSLLRSRYKNFEIIIVDDGSKDGTWRIVQSFSANAQVRGVRQKNMGKSAAINRGLRIAQGDIVISIDADTIFLSQTIGKLIRHFANPYVGAVAGVVKVGNVRNYLARWQALEYITGINIERSAQAYVGAIMIAPGACAAWRKAAITDAGGYSGSTLAEDCDLTIAIHKAGYTVIQDIEAVAYTESPLTLRSLAKQRFRWLFGNIQVFWKHRDVILRRKRGWLGMYVVPNAIFSVIVPVVFTPVLVIIALENIAAGQLSTILFYFMIISLIQFLAALIGLVLAREQFMHLIALPMYRFVYSPVRTYLLYASVFTMLKGAHVGWNKLKRTSTVTYHATPKRKPVLGRFAVQPVKADGTGDR